MKKLTLFFGSTLVLLSADTFGPKWTSVSNGLTGSVPSITALVVETSTGSTLYASTSAGGIFRSSDAGRVG
jgi:hypothetical protein